MSPRQGPIHHIESELEADRRGMEMIILGQMRDGMALVNTALLRLGERVDALNNGLVAVVAAKYDTQISDLRIAIEKAFIDQERRIRSHEKQLNKLGVGMAISSVIGSSALAGLIALILTRIFGAS